MIDREILEKEFNDKIQELEEKLSMAEAVKRTEVVLNQGFRDQLEIKDIQKVGKLREQINQWKRS